MASTATDLDAERSDLLAMLGKHRYFLRHTVRELTDAQARTRTTVSELTLGGLIKHVALTERGWARFIVAGPDPASGPAAMTEADYAAWADKFRLLDGETLAGVLDGYAAAAAETDELVRTLPDLSVTQPLPSAPWFPAGERWSARRVLMHIIAETAQHAGHADILREALDGAKSMG